MAGTQAWGDNTGILITMLAGFFLYFFKRWWDNTMMRKNLARILHTELYLNRISLMHYGVSGLDDKIPLTNNVYLGMLSSGNIHYLSAYQRTLHLLYSSMERNGPHTTRLMEEALVDLGQIMRCPFSRLCGLSPLSLLTRAAGAVRRRAGGRS